MTTHLRLWGERGIGQVPDRNPGLLPRRERGSSASDSSEQEWIDAAVNAYRRHIEPADDELDRLEAVMYIRTLYLACFGYRRALTNGSTFHE